MSRRALACAVTSALVAASAVAQQRIGLGLTVALVLVIAAGALAARRPRARGLTLLAAGLAVQPVLRAAGWVVAIDVATAVAGTAAAVAEPASWPRVAHAMLAPLRLVPGVALIGRALAELR